MEKLMMKRVSIVLFVLALCYLIGSALDVAYYYCGKISLWQPSIACDDQIISLGKISCESEPLNIEFVVQNKGNRPLQVLSVKPGCGGCVEIVSYPRYPIEPHSSASIFVRLNYKNLKGKIDKEVAIYSNDPKQRIYMFRIQADIVLPENTDKNNCPLNTMHIEL
jgi:hypothetical protein